MLGSGLPSAPNCRCVRGGLVSSIVDGIDVVAIHEVPQIMGMSIVRCAISRHYCEEREHGEWTDLGGEG